VGQNRQSKNRGLHFFYGKGNINHQLGTGYFVHNRIVVMRVEFVSDSMLYIDLRSCCCNIIVPSLNTPSE
jgi:hypothetical protein